MRRADGLAPAEEDVFGDAVEAEGRADGDAEPVAGPAAVGECPGAACPGLPPRLNRNTRTMINNTSSAPTTRARLIQ